MGAVYRAIQTSLDREVAIKILPKELCEDPDFLASFKTEARAMAKLNHPNLIGIYDSGEADGMLYIVMEYVAGKSLYHSCWNKQIDPDEVKRIIGAICNGLYHAHESGIIHRDIKPANILLTPKVEPKIGDFGLAQALGTKFEGIVMGTPGYTAPEIMSHPEKMDRRSDIFAVGIMLYEMLVGKLPEGASLPSQLSTCSPEFDTIYQNATHPNPALRYAEAKQMGDALLAISNTSNSGKKLQTAPSKAQPKIGGGNMPVGGRIADTLPKSPLRPNQPSLMAKQAAPMAKAAAPVAKAAAPITKVPAVVTTPAVQPAIQPAVQPAIQPGATAKPAAPNFDDEDDSDDIEPLVVPTFNRKQTVSSWPLIRNLMIICVLIIACVFAYQWKEVREKNVRQQEADYARTQKEKAMAEERERKIANEKAQNTKDPVTKPFVPKKDEPRRELTQMEELEDMQFALSRGDRQVMPKGTKRRGELDYLLIKDKMRWDRALEFAEKFGAHVAFPTSQDDLPFFTEMLTDEETIWLGCGKSGRDEWFLIDGNAWPIEKKPSGAGHYATLSFLGLVQSSTSEKENSFILAWYRDGSMPHTLERILEKTRKSLDDQNPQFPPGALIFGSRVFLPLLREVNFADAQKLANAAGAHVSSLSTEEESIWVDDTLPSGLTEHGLWLNGKLKAGEWKWGTGEKWSFANWSKEDDQNEDEDATQLAVLPSKGWIKADPSDKLDGVLLEWSKDPVSGAQEAISTDANGIKDYSALNTKATSLIATAKKTRDEDHAKNIKQFNWDMDVWFRTLKPSDQALWKQIFETVKTKCSEKIIPADQFANADGEIPEIHKSISDIHIYCLQKQAKIDAAYTAQVTKIRDAYVGKIKEFGSAAKSSGQTQLVEKLKGFLEDAEDLEAWAESLAEDDDEDDE